MKNALAFVGLCVVCALPAMSADGPPAEAFRVLPPAAVEGPTITPYLEYQTEMAWREDDPRRKEWAQIRTEQIDSLRRKIRENLLDMLGGLPERTPLNPHITGTIRWMAFISKSSF